MSAEPARPERDDEPPARIDLQGVPTPEGGHDAFVVTLAVVAALLALIVTLGWVVYHRLVAG
jgi:uncharacterized membrane protein